MHFWDLVCIAFLAFSRQTLNFVNGNDLYYFPLDDNTLANQRMTLIGPQLKGISRGPEALWSTAHLET